MGRRHRKLDTLTTRDELAEIVNGRPLPKDGLRTVGAIYERGAAYERADRILSRWRLVPVEEQDEPDYDSIQQVWIRGYNRGARDAEVIAAAQHRAADELTRHDQDAGIYDGCACEGREQRLHRRSYDGRTDNHGPHED